MDGREKAERLAAAYREIPLQQPMPIDRETAIAIFGDEKYATA
jgi:hypothetical protein